jgi:hypothetical protein
MNQNDLTELVNSLFGTDLMLDRNELIQRIGALRNDQHSARYWLEGLATMRFIERISPRLYRKNV